MIFIWFLLLLTLGFACSSLSSCFKFKVRLFIWHLSCFLRLGCVAINVSLRTALATLHCFRLLWFKGHLSLGFIFLISSLIFLVINWLFCNVLFSLYVFVLLFFFFSVFPCILFLISLQNDLKTFLIWFQFSSVNQGLICAQRCYLSWRMFHVNLRRNCVLLLLEGMFHKFQVRLV